MPTRRGTPYFGDESNMNRLWFCFIFNNCFEQCTTGITDVDPIRFSPR